MKSNFIYTAISIILVSQMGIAQNNSLSFDGDGDYVSIGAEPVGKPCTAEFWVKRRSDTGFQVLLEKSNFSFRLEQWGASNKVGYTKDGTYDTHFNYVAPEEEWVHLAIVATADSTTLFVNGSYYSKNPQTIGVSIPLITIGKNGSNTLNATLDELRVWNVARTENQIASSMSAELNGNESGLVAYYKMNSGSGTFLTDHSSSGNHGTISGATWSSDVPENLASTNDLIGTYSIGEGADYATFYAAASALNSYGVSGPVTFNVLNGTYDGDFSLNSITGTSEANTITFQSYSGNAGDVIVTDSYSYASYVAQLNGADYVNFKNMTFDRSTTGSGYTKLIEIRSGTNYITFDNCIFKGYDHNSSSANYSLIYTANSDQYDGIVIKNCTFTDGGGYAIDLRYGATGGTGLEIANNSFTDTYGGIYAKYFDGVTIRGNTIKGPGLYDTGIRLDYCDGANVVEDNSIYGPDMIYGLYLTYCQSASGSEATIFNNLISVEDYGIYMHQYNTYQSVYYNSVRVRDSNALYYHSNNDQFDSKNNIFYSASLSSPALYVYSSTGYTGNYNDLFSNYTYPVYYGGNQSFTEYQATGNGASSVNLEPVYNTDSTLVPMRLALDNLGTPIAGITDDINGDTRSETTPDMGATEFTPSGSALSGSYTIGTGGDYTTFQSARDALVANAIGGPVVFNILAGTYDEPLLLNEVVGASSTNRVTFQSADANADSVIWENTANSSNTNYVLKLNGTDHITLKNITFKSQGSSYSQKIVLYGVTNSVTIESNTFLGYQGGSSSNHVSVYGGGSDAEDLTIKNNTFKDGGYYAIYLDSDNTSSSPTGLTIIGNTISNTYGGIYAEYFDGVTVRGNTIKGSYMFDKAIYLYYCDGANVVEDNTIYAPDMGYGIYLNYCQATSGNEATIANNLISVEDYGIYMYQYNNYHNVYYNSVKVRDTNALYYYSLNLNNVFKNNILYTESTNSPALYVANSTGFTGDYNDLYSGYSYPIYYSNGYKTLFVYQASGQGEHSVELDPVYNTDSTLVPMRLALDNLGTSVAGITDDINGTTRSETTPDMGAIEFTPSSATLSGTYTVGTGGDFSTLDGVRNALVATGVSGPVTFRISAGTYTELISLNEISGASATNTITIQSADANADSVVWENTTNSSNINNFVLSLDGTDHIRLKHITFKHQGSVAARNITLTGVVDSVTIDSCRFLGYPGSASYNYSLIYGNEIDATGLRIMNSTFIDGGGHAIYLSSSNSSSSPTGLLISGNTITDTYGGIYARYYDAVTIRGNTIKGSYMHSQGIELRYCDGASVIEDNHIYCPDLSYGIYLTYCQTTSGNEAVIANNLITAEDNGIYLYQHNYYQSMYYNSVKVRDSNALYSYNGNSNNTLINNILLTEATSTPAAYIYSASLLTSSDHNNFYTSYTYPVYYGGNKTLSEWQSYGQDSSSVSIDPVFDTDSTLVPLALVLDNLGTPIGSIADDINGIIRSETTPDMGAIEFSVSGSPLSGSYTIGTGGDFATINSVGVSLLSLGVSGPVTFNILAGSYDEPVALGQVYGASATNTITFQSADANADSVIWENTANSSTSNYIVKLNGTDHITLKNITFKNQGSYYSQKIVLIGVTDSVSIENNTFLGYQGGSSSNHVSVYGGGADAEDLTIRNNTFTDGGYFAIYLDSDNSSSSPTGLEISDNTFNNTYSGIYAEYFYGVTVRGNTIKGSYMYDYGLFLYYCNGANVVEDNSIYAPDMSYGLYLNYCQAASGNEATIVNNLISVEDYGIYFYRNNYYQNIYYNSVRVRDSYAFYTYYGSSNNTLINNILLTESTSVPAAYINNTSVFTSSNYNNYFSTYDYPIYYNGNKTLAEWQGYGQDSSSINVDPLFNDDSSLVPTSFILDNKGTPITGITDDIYGNNRSETTPDMGAIEFSVSGSYLAGSYTIGSGGDYDSISMALNDLSIYGVSGPVIFNILAGTYNDPVALGQVYGASATNTITVQSSDANADSVTWESTDNSSGTNYVLMLNGADHIKLKHITFKNVNTTYSRKLVLSGIADSITVDSCTFLGKYQAGSQNIHSAIFGNTIVASGFKIKNSTFTYGGSYAIYLNSNNSSSSPTGLEISGNTFNDTYNGIFLQYFDAVTIRGNTLSGSYMYDHGLYLNYCDGANVIEDNSIYAPDMSYGLYLNYCQAASGNEATIVNNLISVEDYGIYIYYYNYYQNIYYNTVKVRDSYALYIYNGNSNNISINNIFYTESTATQAAYYFNTSVVTISDYNDYFSSYDYPIYYSGNRTLSEMQGFGQDSSSLNINPMFDADSSLVPTSYILDNKGAPIAGITDDMYGSTRSETAPDMGAIEFSVAGSVLSGNYTVGTAGDFDSISNAINSLVIYGVSGPVTFNILPGTYTEQLTIGEVYGASSINTLTIQSSTGDTADVSWQYTPTSSANYVLKINNTDHLTIRNIGFDVSASSSYGTILEISGETDSLRIEGNEFRGYPYNSNSANHYLVESTSNTGTGMVFSDNTFLQGSAGMLLNNGGADDGEFKIINNTSIGQYFGFWIQSIDSIEVSGNTVAGDHGGYGIYVRACNPAIVTGNKVTENTINSMNRGIYIHDCDGNTSDERTLIANNMVKAYGLALDVRNTDYADIYYNTLINTYTNSSTSYGTLYIYYPSEMNVKNNIITNTSGGRLTYQSNGGSSIVFDHNMYYGGSTDYGFYSHNPSVNGSFTSWQAAGFDTNSVLQDPGFYAYGDGFHLGAGNSLGTPLTEVTIDFDNEPRDDSTPDIGADEYLAPNYDGVVEVPGELTTIQGAIDIAVSGDSIKVAAGTYTENIDFSGKNIVVVGSGRETTILDGNQSESVVKFISGEDSTAVLMGFTITNGAAEHGGGIYLYQSSPSLYDLTVSQNTASSSGGGICSYNQSNPILKNSSVVNNSSEVNAGGIRCWDSSNMKLENVVIANNTSSDLGGGMHCRGNSSPILMNVTLINNSSLSSAGGIYLRSNSNPIIVNSIIWGNTPQNIYFRAGEQPSHITLSYSDLEGGQDSIVTNDNGTVTWGDGNIDLDPLFLNADSGDYHLSDLSPVISAATDSVQIGDTWYMAPSIDMDGNFRPNPENTLPDMGAYENENGAGDYNGPVWYVDASSELPYANGSATAKFSKIQYGINAANEGDTVLVAEGTYFENIDFITKNIVVLGANREYTIIDGGEAGRVVTFQSGELPSAVLRGFTIQNGLEANGGGIYCTGASSPSLYDLIITNNSANGGGGVHCFSGSSPRLENISIINNSAIGNNGRGGGLRCTTNSDPILVNVLISDNTATQEGGGVFCYNSDPSFINVTISGNVSSIDDGGGMFIKSNSNVNLLNTVIGWNESNEIEFSSVDDSSAITILYSNIAGGLDSIITNDNGTVIWGYGSQGNDPHFVNPDSSNYHLLASSLCINAGHPDSLESDGSIVDMGVFPYLNSYSGPVWFVETTGNDTIGTGSSDSPFASIQSAINFATTTDDSVTVAAGTYIENINFRGRNIKVVGEDKETTTIDGDENGSVVVFDDGIEFNQYQDAVLKNFTITNGSGWEDGSGIKLHYFSSPTLTELVVTNNMSYQSAGGISCESSCHPIIENVIVSNNTSASAGGVMCSGGSNPTLTNVTITGNTANENGGGIFLNQNNNVNVLNSIIWNNGPQEIFLTGESDTIAVAYSDVLGGQTNVITNGGSINWDIGNIDVDPLFVDTSDYGLTADSRCIDSGHPDYTDSDGTIADMGAYYYDQTGQPVRVSNLITTPSADNVLVKWNTNSDAASYNVYRSIDGSTDFYLLNPYTTASDTSYIDESVDDNTTYHYRVSAVDSESDEGIMAFARHGRTGNDTTALSMGADDRWISVLSDQAPVFTPDQDYTLECYFHPLGYQNAVEKIFSAGGLTVSLVVVDPDSFLIRIMADDGSVLEGDAVIQDSSWHHLAVTAHAGGNISLWLDGHMEAEGVDIALAGSGSVEFNSADPEGSIDGILDEVWFSNSIRYTMGFIPPNDFQVDENTLALWHFNEGSFDQDFPTVYDWGGNGYHGVPVGTTNPDWVSGSPTQPEGQVSLVINELMPNPNGSDGGKEWIELYNNYYTPLILQDWILAGSGNGETVTLSVDRAISPGAYVLLAQDGDSTANGGLAPDIVYGTGVSFGNNQETVFIKDASGGVVDSVAYSTDFPYSSGTSMELVVPHWNNDDSLSWVAAGLPYGDGDNLGSPGRKNDSYSGIIQSSLVAHDFSYITQGESDSISFWIENVGVTELNVSQINTLTETFTVNPSQATISVGDSTEIEIQFNPIGIAGYTDTLSILSDDPYNPLVTIFVTGTGINEYADIVVSYGDNDSVSFFNFPFTRVNDTWLDTLFIINVGSPDLEIEEIFIDGDGFSTPVESGLVEFMDTLLIPITFTPETEGTYSASLVINCPNDLDEATYTIQLSGVASDHIVLLVPEVYATIQGAINSAYLEDTVQVGPGTYEETLHFGDLNLVLRSEMGPLETFIEGDGIGSVVTIAGGQTSITQVIGFTITGGGGTDGGGLRIDSLSSPVINDMIIVENSADEGAGAYINNSSPVFSSVILKNNEASSDGGGIAVRENSSPVFNYVVITNNGGDNGAGILVRDNSSPVFNHMTVSDNVSESDGGAFYIRNGSHAQLVNSTVWNNGEEAIYFSSTGSSSEISVDYSIVDGGESAIVANGSTINWGTGNLELDPLFIDQYSLQWGSPAIDAGDPSSDPDPDGTIADMGALYYDQTYQPPDPPVGLTYAPGSGEVSLSWDVNDETDLTHYVVYKGTASDALDSLAVVAAPTAEYVDTALDPTVINYYALTAVDTASLASEPSAVLIVSFPTLSVSDEDLSFGDVRVGVIRTLQLTLSNTGSDTLFVDSIYVSDSLSGFSVSLGEMNTSRSLIDRMALSKSPLVVTPFEKSHTRSSNSARSSNGDQPNSRPRNTTSSSIGSRTSINNNTDPKTTRGSSRSGPTTPGNTAVDDSKESSQSTTNSILTISTEVMPGESIGLDVSFMREDTLTVANELRITSDDPLGNDLVSVGLSGRSVSPVLVLEADTLDFGNILTESQISVMVSNDGTDTLNVSGIAFPAGFTGSMEDSTLVPGGAAHLIVSLAPEDNGYWSGDVQLTSDSYQQSEHSVVLSALSMNALLVHDFGGVLTGQTSDTTFTLNNTGNTDLILDSLSTGHSSITTEFTDGTTLATGSSQSIMVTFAPTTADSIIGEAVLHTPLGSFDFGTLKGDGWNWPEAQFAAKSLSVVTAQGDNVSFNISLANSGDYTLEYTTIVDAEFAGFIWLTTGENGQVPASSSIDLLVDVQQTENLDPGTYSGSIYFNTNTGGVDPDQIIANTDTVDIFLTLLVDDSQLSDTTVTVASGNTEAIVFIDENGDPMGVVVDFANSNGGTLTIQRIAAQPPVDESTPWMDPDGLITDPVFPEKYFEITTDIEGEYLTDIGFDYTTLPGIEDHLSLRLAKRPGNSGPAEPWTIIPISSTEYNTIDGLVVAQQQTSFSQWAMLSNESDNSFTDTQGPEVTNVQHDPASPGVLEDVIITADLSDGTGIDAATLYYAQGGNSGYTSLTMSGNSGSYAGTIPGSAVTMNGLFYYVGALDPLGYSTSSDTTGVSVNFADGSLTTNSVTGSAYPSGLPIDKWRLISMPAVLDETGVGLVIGDELGTQDDELWRLFEYNQTSSSYIENPIDFIVGESYWIYQRVENDLLIGTAAGETGNMSGTSLSLVPGWSFIGSPYPFEINISLDQVQFYGPITYGLAAEEWSSVVTELDPWNGYAIYNRTASDQVITLDPTVSSAGLAARVEDQEKGWLISLRVSADEYQDRFNLFGALETADNGLEWHDNPEITSPGKSVSLFFNISDNESVCDVTSDVRALDDHLKLWDARIRTSDLDGAMTLSWYIEQELPADKVVQLVDLNTRTVVDMQLMEHLELGHVDSHYDRQINIISGDQAEVAGKIFEILTLIPEELSLEGNYPNPFNPVTTIRFGIPRPRNVRVTVVNILGQEITELVNGWRDIGHHEVVWQGLDQNGKPVATGMYFTVLSDGNKIIVQKMLLLK